MQRRKENLSFPQHAYKVQKCNVKFKSYTSEVTTHCRSFSSHIITQFIAKITPVHINHVRSLIKYVCTLGCPTKIENYVTGVDKRCGNIKMTSLLLFLISSTLRSSDAQKPKPNMRCAHAQIFYGAQLIKNALKL